MKRYLYSQVIQDLKSKMVFVGGPRQVGKTTLAKSILSEPSGYLNWDIDKHRSLLLERELPDTEMWVFDEIHKYRRWRGFLKGLYDEFKGKKRILVTGSARLDYYRYGGESLQGRYHFLRLHPLSLGELKSNKRGDLQQLFELGGFPEPFFAGSAAASRRWSREYRSRLIRDEVSSIENVSDLGLMELLLTRLPDLVCNPLSINGLREDLELAHKTVARWLDILERFYAIFRLSPFGSPKIKAVKKEQKHYHFDWNLIKSDGARFENLVASNLLKWVQFHEDTEGRDLELRYFRDIDGREVDFVVLEDRKPIAFIECKLSDDQLSKPLLYLHHKFPTVPAYQVHLNGTKDYLSADGVRVIPATKLLGEEFSV